MPAVFLSTLIGALNGYVVAQWRFKGANIIFSLMLFGCFIPFQVVLLPMARLLGMMGIAGTIPGLIFVHVIYGLGFTTLFFRNYYVTIPSELTKAARVDGAGFLRIFWSIFLPLSLPIIVVTVIWQFTQIWNDFLFGVSFSQAGHAARDRGAQQHRKLHHRRQRIQRRHGRRDHRGAADAARLCRCR